MCYEFIKTSISKLTILQVEYLETAYMFADDGYQVFILTDFVSHSSILNGTVSLNKEFSNVVHVFAHTPRTPVHF